jgi:hypothetical protein
MLIIHKKTGVLLQTTVGNVEPIIVYVKIVVDITTRNSERNALKKLNIGHHYAYTWTKTHIRRHEASYKQDEQNIVLMRKS